MNHTSIKKVIALLYTGIFVSNTALATVFFEEDFESTFPGTYPNWTLPPVLDNNIGPGNFFELTNVSCNSGNSSLRIDTNAQNGFCNTCGVKVIQHSNDSQYDGVQYFVSKNGEDVTDMDDGTLEGKGPGAKTGYLVYNKTAGYSQWEITAINNENAVNDRVELKLLQKGIGGETPDFSSNDDVAFARKCGVDGNVGLVGGVFDIDKRSDCNNLINWFRNVQGGVQSARQSIWRRFYFKAELASPPSHQKLRYWSPPGAGIIVFADSNRSDQFMEIHISGFGRIGGDSLYKQSNGNLPPSAIIERGVWYYMEEEFKPESSDGAADGVYKLWYSKTSDADISDPPILVINNIELPPIEGGGSSASFWGNTQHNKHVVGQWYIDDMKISDDARIGPVTNTCTDTPPPKSPDTI